MLGRLLQAFFLLAAIVSCSDNEVEPPKPNFVLINIDDMGWKDVGFMGSDFYKTPNIDALANSGMIFTQGYASASNCAPSRASLMTGKWSTRHGMYTVQSSERGKSGYRKIIPTENTRELDSSFHTLPAILKTHGYKTIHAGKWHISPDPTTFGIDINIGGNFNGAPRSYYPPYKNVDLEHEPDEYLTDAIARHLQMAIDTIQGPFFLNYAPYAVHTPIHPVEELVARYEGKESSFGQENAKYASMIENLDNRIGELIDILEKRGILENTLIIFTTDNGGLYGITKQPPLRAGKGSYYEGGIRVPFAFSWKGKIQSGSINEQPISNLDLFPTLLALAGVDYQSYNPDGRDLISQLEGTTSPLERDLFWHFPIYLQAYRVSDNQNRDSLFRTRPGSVVRSGDWKLHYYFEDNDVELYNLREDISEVNDLSKTDTARLTLMMSKLEQWWRKTEAPRPSTPNPEYRSFE